MSSSHFDTNRSLWNAWADLNARSELYDVAGFKRGETSLRPIEVGELGEVSGRSLLHLQCHFGLDTMSWARRGASVTGIDFSPEAIKLARSLASELNIDARFIESNIYD